MTLCDTSTRRSTWSLRTFQCHASPDRLALTKGFDVHDQYQAACALMVEIARLTLMTLSLAEGLVNQGALDLEAGTSDDPQQPGPFDVEVVVSQTRRELTGRVLGAPTETPVPESFDAPPNPAWGLVTAPVPDQDDTRTG